MVAICDLEVDVNGEEAFLVSKGILSSFSGRLRKLFSKPSLSSTAETSKVVFRNFPGSVRGFELMARFCYNNGRIQITPSDACLLHCVADYMEMTEDASSFPSLIKLTEVYLLGIPCWSWSEIMSALRQCQDFLPSAISSGILDRIIDSVAGRITTAGVGDTTPSGSSPESSAFRFSCDTRSSISTRSGIHRAWWFEDLALLNTDMIQQVIASMVLQKVDNVMISRFLFYYLKCGAHGSPSEKRKATETAIDLLHSLDRSCVSCKGLFNILRVASSLRLSKSCHGRLENMIGSQIDQTTLDGLLIPAPIGIGSLYDVSLVLRFLKSFLASVGQASMTRMKRVGCLIDSYLAEVAPDPSLEPSKFAALITILPDAARDSHDAIYRAVDLYLEVHGELSEEERMKICYAINHDMLSSESCMHLAGNPKFPSRTAVQALISQQSKLKSLLQNTDSAPPKDSKHKKNRFDNNKLDCSTDNEKLSAQLHEMQWRVTELEKICKKMQTQMAEVMKNTISNPSGSRSLPMLCSRLIP
ncbi:BTB/POZ domain-containing protein At3g22104-like isoform X1 [Musa acuminata AAA Group]|uniref:Uncharacterized protein n=1 Tax=Musa acuminata subsp. malaccensis TaxID=214687 RepID=A0A804I3B3_MUSAM|nr:PREDICTED: BTB/POZ domain-containing protein At3g22104 isoform X1 [Musa acuminata subsp. malaccensis]